MHVKKSLIILLLFINSILVAQEIRIPNSIIATYNDEGIISLFTEKKYYKVDLLNYEISEPTYFENNGFDIKGFSPIKIDSAFYFISRIGGAVLKLKENTLTRIDNSFNHKMQLGSTIFKYNNEIYRYGGYGFFSSRDFIVKYDFVTNEWESIIITNNEVPKGRSDNSFLLNKDEFIIMGGNGVDRLNRRNRINLNDSWQFSFKDRRWNKVASDDYFNYFSSDFFKTKNGVGTIKGGRAYLYFNKDLCFKTYEVSPILLKRQRLYKMYFYDNLYHFIIKRNNKMILLSRTKKELFGTSIAARHINKNNNLKVIMALVLFSIIVFLTLSIHQYYYYLIIRPNRLKFKSYKINLSEEEHTILQEFILNQHIIENSKLQKILDKEQYDRSNNIRLKNKFILGLNSKLQYLFNNNTSNYIQIQQSSFDKRYKRYFLNLENKKLINSSKPAHRRFTYLLILSIIFLVLWIELELSVFKTLFNVS
jgi:hypothetical protein